jgi:hypothetical protein
MELIQMEFERGGNSTATEEKKDENNEKESNNNNSAADDDVHDNDDIDDVDNIHDDDYNKNDDDYEDVEDNDDDDYDDEYNDLLTMEIVPDISVVSSTTTNSLRHVPKPKPRSDFHWDSNCIMTHFLRSMEAHNDDVTMTTVDVLSSSSSSLKKVTETNETWIPRPIPFPGWARPS